MGHAGGWFIVLASCLIPVAHSHAQGRISNQDCQDCHAETGLTRTGPGGEVQSLFVDSGVLKDTVHGGLSCVDCHEGIRELPHPDKLPRVSCGSCHAGVPETISASVHGTETAQKTVSCRSCHGEGHSIFPTGDARSPVYPLSVYRTCGTCHFEKAPPEAGEAAPLSYERYLDDIHGHGVVKSGLIVSATCVSCHGGHDILSSDNPGSRVAGQKIVSTCGACHVGNARDFSEGSHGKPGDPAAVTPTCVTCHLPHRIQRVSVAQVLEINRTCGSCHDSRQKSYSETYHGKVTALGYTGVASCEKCHRAHLVLPASDPRSSVHPEQLVSTCGTCHPGAQASFASYLVHVDHQHLDEYPVLYWASMGMTGLLIGVFSFFGLHTFLWAFRYWRERRAAPPEAPGTADPSSGYIQRLSFFQRVMHLVVIVSFLGLALTGLPLKYSEARWASWLVSALGGFRMASALHRLCAVLSFGYFFTHLGHIAYRILVNREKGLLYGPDSMTPRPKDFRDLLAVFGWFFGKGNKPQFDRWAYWEKFDYWAVFWGMAIIGTSGLILAFPIFFTSFLPGRVVNLALIVHTDEALLAVGFIFTIHFFNTHLKPEKYPMDTVYYTGRAPLGEYERDHPLELERLKATGRLEALRAEAPPARWIRQARVLGFTAVAIGLALLVLILIAAVFH